MPKAKNGRIQLEDELEVGLPDGTVVRLRPGPYRKGIAIVPLTPEEAGPSPGKGGRKPRPSTVRLRGRLQKDLEQDAIGKPREYVEWLMGIDPDLSLASARQIVYRERRLALEGE